MKKMLIRAVALGVLLFPGLVFAAYNDVSLDSNTTITVGGFNLTVSGSTAAIESIVVNDSSFTVGLASGSTFSVSSSDKKNFVVGISGAGVNETDSCGATSSTMTLTATAGVNVTVTPSGTCTSASGGGGSGGGGGGGGGGSIVTMTTLPATAVTPITPAPAATTAAAAPLTATARQALITQLIAQINALRAQLAALPATNANASPSASAVVNANANASFKRDITVGVKGDDVKALQVWLNTHGYVIAGSGPGSLGKETTTFGGLTRAALIKFQKANGITPASGYFGPKTRRAVGGGQ